jgi:hypothetical protein
MVTKGSLVDGMLAWLPRPEEGGKGPRKRRSDYYIILIRPPYIRPLACWAIAEEPEACGRGGRMALAAGSRFLWSRLTMVLMCVMMILVASVCSGKKRGSGGGATKTKKAKKGKKKSFLAQTANILGHKK